MDASDMMCSCVDEHFSNLSLEIGLRHIAIMPVEARMSIKVTQISYLFQYDRTERVNTC